MTDEELVKRLRRHRYNTWNDDLGPEQDKALAADRIEQLQQALKEQSSVSDRLAEANEKLTAERDDAVIKRAAWELATKSAEAKLAKIEEAPND